MKKYILYLMFFWFLLSCGNNRKFYNYDIEEANIDSVPSIDIYGELLPINIYGTNSLFIADSLLMIDKQDGSRYYFEVYNVITYDSISSFGLRGRAKYEFLDMPVVATKQYYYNNKGDIIVPVIDANLIKELNLSQSVKRNHTVIERMSPCYTEVEGSTVLMNNDPDQQLVYYYAHEDGFHKEKEKLPLAMVLKEQKTAKRIKCFGKLMKNKTDTQKLEHYYWGKLVIQPNSDKAALPLYLMNYILFFNPSDNEYHAVHIKNMPTFEDGITSEVSLSCFLSADATEEYIYAYYSGDFDIEAVSNPEYKGRILQFDWSGQLIRSYLIHDAVLTDISYNAMTNTFYGMNIYSGDLYSFHLH